VLTIRNSEVVYAVSGFVHVILEFDLWGNTKECEKKILHEIKA